MGTARTATTDTDRTGRHRRRDPPQGSGQPARRRRCPHRRRRAGARDHDDGARRRRTDSADRRRRCRLISGSAPGRSSTARPPSRSSTPARPFIVSPVFRRDVLDVCAKHDVPAMPGCFTPTEILDAWEHGADVVKVFPATALGPGYIKDVRAPLPHVKLMPTGGVTLDNAGEWIQAGAVAVGVGSSLLDTKAIDAGNFGVIPRQRAAHRRQRRAAREGNPSCRRSSRSARSCCG